MIVGSRAVLRHGLAGDKRAFTSIDGEHRKQMQEYLESQRQHLESKVMNIDTLAVRIFQALARRERFSFIRLGDSELLVLAQELVFPVNVDITEWGPLLSQLCFEDIGQGDKGERHQKTIMRDRQLKVAVKEGPSGRTEVKRWRRILEMSGVGYPDLAARDYMQKALLSASVIGIPTSYRPGRSQEHIKLLKGFQTVFLAVLDKMEVSLDSLSLADSAGHHMLQAEGWLRKFMLPNQYPGLCHQFGLSESYQPRILLIGNLAHRFEGLLVSGGCNLAGIIRPVGMNNIEETIAQAGRHSFDLALVSAGTAAKYICTSLAQDLGKVAIDTGQLFAILTFDYRHLNHEGYVIPFDTVM